MAEPHQLRRRCRTTPASSAWPTTGSSSPIPDGISLARTGLFARSRCRCRSSRGCLAVLVNQPIQARGLFRTLLYLPAVVPPVGAALTFKLIFDRDSGAANGVLDALNLDGVSWLLDPYAR